MATPKFLDNPESNEGIIRQIIFPKFRGINKFLYTKEDNKMVYKTQQNTNNNEYVQFNFDNTLKYETILTDIQNKDFDKITKIFSDLIIECIKTIGLSEYIINEIDDVFINALNTFNYTDFIFQESQSYNFDIEKLMNGIFKKYELTVISSVTTAPSISIFFPSFNDSFPKIANLPKIDEENKDFSEYYKYLQLLNFENAEESFFTKEEYLQFDDDGLALLLSYAFYYTLKDIFSSCYLYIKLPDPPLIPEPFNELSLNILEEITLDLKNITNAQKLPEILAKLPQDVILQRILTKANGVIDFKGMRDNKSSYEELKDKFRQIHNYYKNDRDNEIIRVIQLE
jgi:hypothetical protein